MAAESGVEARRTIAKTNFSIPFLTYFRLSFKPEILTWCHQRHTGTYFLRANILLHPGFLLVVPGMADSSRPTPGAS